MTFLCTNLHLDAPSVKQNYYFTIIFITNSTKLQQFLNLLYDLQFHVYFWCFPLFCISRTQTPWPPLFFVLKIKGRGWSCSFPSRAPAEPNPDKYNFYFVSPYQKQASETTKRHPTLILIFSLKKGWGGGEWSTSK